MATGFLYKGYFNYTKDSEPGKTKTHHFYGKNLDQLDRLRKQFSSAGNNFIGEKVTQYRA